MKESLRTVPNVITFCRILLVPVFIGLTLYHRFGPALIVFVVAGLTDALDGYVARSRGAVTRLGSLLDAIADKILIVSGFVLLSVEGSHTIPLWLTVTVISRDAIIVAVSLCILVIAGKTPFSPSVLGKVSTVVQVTTISTFLLFNYRESGTILLALLCWITMAATVSSGLHYLYGTFLWMSAQGEDTGQ